MAWKPKEKPLTAEEAVDLARKELAPYWVGSDPVLAAISTGQVATAHPIDPLFTKKSWLFLFVDCTRFSSRAVLSHAQEWHRRYHGHDFRVAVVLNSPFAGIRTPALLRREINSNGWSMVLVLDHEGLLSRAFGVTSENSPRAVYFRDGKLVFDHVGEKWFENTELKVQQELRKTDPGLALLNVQSLNGEAGRDRVAVNFSDQSLYPKPGFVLGPNGHKVARFPEKGAHLGFLTIGGIWLLDGERIVTADPNAFIQLSVQGTKFAIIGQPLKERGMIQVELSGQPVRSEFCGVDLQMNDHGDTSMKLRDARAYFLLDQLSSEHKEVVLRFPDAAAEPVVLYGVRWGDSLNQG